VVAFDNDRLLTFKPAGRPSDPFADPAGGGWSSMPTRLRYAGRPIVAACSGRRYVLPV